MGGVRDLEILNAAQARLSNETPIIETALIHGADHMYTGEEAQVARVIDSWVRRAFLARR